MLPSGDCQRLEGWESHLLRDAHDAKVAREELNVPRPYVDPGLVRSPRVYGEFLRCLHKRGMLLFQLVDGNGGALGIFFVKKKNGKLRIILLGS